MKRIAILVNKDFEYAGFVEGLRDTVQVYAGTNGRDTECRFNNLIADIYCIQHLFKEGENSSNSEIKYGHLWDLYRRNSFRLEDIDGIFSFSTSESTPVSQNVEEQGGDASRNGCVYVGNKFFLSNQAKNDTKTNSRLDIGCSNTNYTEFYNEPLIGDALYGCLNHVKMPLKQVPTNSAKPVSCIANKNFTCVGVVNVMDYSRYKYADESAYNLFLKQSLGNEENGSPIGIETTHGVVVKSLKETCTILKLKNKLDRNKNIPVNFISPIVDRYLKFDEDVDGMYGKQNFVSSYNGGVVTGKMLKILNDNWL